MYEILEGLLHVISRKSFTVYNGMVALSPPDRLSKKRLASDSSVLIKQICILQFRPQKSVAILESVDIDIPNEIASGLKALQSIGCQKIKPMCSVSMEKSSLLV